MLEHLITWVFQLSILATAFGFGLKATTKDVQDLIRRPALLGRSLLAIFVIVPIVAVALAHAFDLPHAAGIAMIALAISPLAALIPINLIKAGRRFSFPAGLMTMVALLSVVVVPLLVALVGRFLGGSSFVSPLRAAGVVAAIVLLPLVAGMVVRALRPVLADRIELPASLVGTVVLRLATLALLLTSLHAIWALIVNGTVIAIAVVVAVGFAAGHVLGGPHPDGRTAGRAAPYYLAPSIEPNPSSSATLPSSANGGDSAKGDENR
jgi:bile acid:Na+ symporter, BASS family